HADSIALATRSLHDALPIFHPVERPTDLGRIVDQALGRMTNRCLVAILSDFFVDPEQFRSALARMKHRRHDVMILQILDRAETEDRKSTRLNSSHVKNSYAV